MQSATDQGRTFLIVLVLVACFLTIAVFRSSFAGINQSVNLWAASINKDSFTSTAKIAAIAFDTNALVALSLVIAGFFFVLHHRRYSLLLLGAMGGDALLVDLCKTLIISPRPLNQIIADSNYSFPSGHVSGTVVLFGVLTYFAWKHRNTTKTKVLTGMIYVSTTVFVAFDRIYLNAHWFSDVVGAVFLGGFWLAFCVYIFNRLLCFASSSNRQPDNSKSRR